ncbi:MAG: BON domain-containing protein, partial [Desulfovibrionaceae bacterium]|nr:BON domain-containing protein [Desulfovibrionaceae bacterium]
VFLVGLFRNRAEANLAMDLTKSVRGVRKVTGCFFLETEDAPYNRDESAMAEERIRDSLAQEKSLQDSDVDISVIQGSAVLVGTVENELDRDRLISLARAENEVLTVKPYLLVSK